MTTTIAAPDGTDHARSGSQVLANARARLSSAIATLGLDDGLHQMLANARRETRVSIPLRRDSGHTEVLTGYRIPSPDIEHSQVDSIRGR